MGKVLQRDSGKANRIASLLITLIVTFTVSGGFSRLHAKEPCLLHSSRLIRFEVVHGLIEGKNIRFGQSRGASAKREKDGVTEWVTLKLKNNKPIVDYRRVDEGGELKVNYKVRESFELEFHPAESSPASEIFFWQLPDGKCEIRVGQSEGMENGKADTLWHLAIAFPALCRHHLFPQLQVIRPGWNLEEQVNNIEEELLAFDPQKARHSRTRIYELVRQIDDKSFAKRRAAQRDLLKLGQIAVGFLRSMPKKSLNSEQKQRIARTLRDLRIASPDLPNTVAMRMVGDVGAWTALAQRQKQAVQTIARQQLRSVRYR